MSLLNLGAGLSEMGKGIATFAHDAGLTAQKAELEKQQSILSDQLATTRETTLAGVQGDQARQTTQVSAEAQGAQARLTQKEANALPMTEAQAAANDLGRDTLNETHDYHVGELKKPVAAGYNGSLVPDPTAPGGWRQIGATSFSPEAASLMGALAERGVSLPAGMRSKQQQMATYQSLLDRNPGKTADEIADGIKAGQIQFGAEKKMTQIAAGMAGKVRFAEEELRESIPLTREAAADVPREAFVPINSLVQMKDEAISDPKLKKLKVYIVGMMNAYDVLAGRGGTDVEKRAEAHRLLTSVDGPEALDAALDAFEVEVAIARRAAKAAMKLEGPEPAAAPSDKPAASPSSIPSWVKPGDQYSPSRNKAKDAQGNEYGQP